MRVMDAPCVVEPGRGCFGCWKRRPERLGGRRGRVAFEAVLKRAAYESENRRLHDRRSLPSMLRERGKLGRDGPSQTSSRKGRLCHKRVRAARTCKSLKPCADISNCKTKMAPCPRRLTSCVPMASRETLSAARSRC